MKTSWFDIILFGFASFAGAFLYQWTKDVPNWPDAAHSGINAITTMISFGLFTQIFNKD